MSNIYTMDFLQKFVITCYILKNCFNSSEELQFYVIFYRNETVSPNPKHNY